MSIVSGVGTLNDAQRWCNQFLYYQEVYSIYESFQAQAIDPELVSKLLGHGVAVSPIVTVEPRRRKFHKAITLSMPAPKAHSQGMINQYQGSLNTTLRLLCSITGKNPFLLLLFYIFVFNCLIMQK